MLKELFSLFGTVGVDNKGANKAIDETNDKANQLAVSMSKAFETAGNVFTKAGQSITKVGKVCSTVTGAVTGVFTAAALKAKDFIGTYESARAIFERKLGATGADQMYETLLNIAKGSRYAQEYLVSAGQTLVSMGVDANHTAKYIQVATDAMSGMGKSGADVQAMAEMFGKMSIQTTLYTEDLNQMLTSGIRVYDILAAKYKTSTDAIKEMASAGELTSADFEYLMDVLSGNVEGMDEFSMAGLALAGKTGTLTGAIDSLNSSFRSFALNITGTNINKGQMDNYEKLKNVVSQLGSTLENVGSKFSFVGDWIGKGLDSINNAITKFNDALNGMSPEKLQTIAKTILEIATAGPALLGIGKATETVGSAFNGLSKVSKVIEGVTGKIPKLASSIGTLPSKVSNVTQVFKNFTSGVGGGLGMIASDIMPKTTSALGKLNQGFQNFGGKISGIFKSVGSQVGSFTQQIQSKIGGAINSVLPNFSAGISKIGGSFSGLFSKVMPLLQSFMPAFSSAFNIAAIAGIVIAGLGLLQSNFGTQINQMLQTASEKGPTIITNLVNGITSKIPDLIAKGSELILNLANTLIANLPALIQGGMQIIAALVTGIAQQLPVLIPKALEIIITVVMGLLDNIDLLIDAGIQLILGLAQGLINAVPQLIEKVPEIIQKLLNALINNAPKLLEAGWQLIVSLVNGIVNSFPKLVEAAGQIIETIWNTLKELPGKAIEWGKDMIQGFIDGIKSMFSNIGKAVSSIGDKIKSFLHFSRPDEGPLRDYETWMPDMIEGLTRTLTNSAPKLYNAAKRIAEGISGNLNFEGTASVNAGTYKAGNIKTNAYDINASRVISNSSLSSKSSGINTLIELLTYYLPLILRNSSKAIYLDKDKLVAELLPDIDEGLAQ